ncbi:MAG: hypothetical protein AAF192_08750 [Pseudomonadota bacterium]
MSKIVIAVGRGAPELSASNRAYAAALEAGGVEVLTLQWNTQPRVLFLGADAVVMRQTWDYQDDPGGFAAWAVGLEAAGARLMNPAAAAIWNNDKRTLLDLGEAGAEIPPTADLTLLGPEDAATAVGGEAFVIKPAFGGSGVGVTRTDRAGLAEAAEAAARALPGRPLMLQAFLPEIAEGEWSLCFIGGAFSHAVRSVPAAGEFRVNSRLGGTRAAAEAPAAARRSAEALLRRVPWPLLYARVDGVMREGGFVITELELTDPELFMHLAPGAAERLAEATMRGAATTEMA